MIEDRKKLILYFLANAFSWGALGIYTVSLSWLIIFLTHKAALVGLFYFSASASSLIITPFVAPYFSKDNGVRSAIWISLIVRSVALIIPLMLMLLKIDAANIEVLIFLVAILFGPANSIFGAASEGLMLRGWSASSRSTIAKRVGLVRQIALASGFGVAGFLVALSGSEISSAISAILGMTSGLICLSFNEKNNEISVNSAPDSRAHFLKLTDGIRFVASNPSLVIAGLVATLGFSVSQMSNALLAPIVDFQQKTSNEFGLITSAWAVGAIAAAMLLNIFSLKKNVTNTWFFLLLILGLLCVIFSNIGLTIFQILIFFSMGAIFSYLRITSGSEIALNTPSELIAKVQLTLSNLISLTALFIYLIPWVLNGVAPQFIFSIWGGVVIFISFGAFLTINLVMKVGSRAS